MTSTIGSRPYPGVSSSQPFPTGPLTADIPGPTHDAALMRHRDRPYHRVVSLLTPTGGVFRLDRKLTSYISRSIAGGWSAFARSDGQDLICLRSAGGGRL